MIIISSRETRLFGRFTGSWHFFGTLSSEPQSVPGGRVIDPGDAPELTCSPVADKIARGPYEAALDRRHRAGQQRIHIHAIDEAYAIKSFSIDIGLVFLHYSTQAITSHAS
ncbi:hypothetical protein [Paraburkholderia youngii]|uniref:hypothetical protein n=1 Tax=Paraburkholderia youngii TaxID=2782701 RepID=UPI003D256E56